MNTSDPAYLKEIKFLKRSVCALAVCSFILAATTAVLVFVSHATVVKLHDASVNIAKERDDEEKRLEMRKNVQEHHLRQEMRLVVKQEHNLLLAEKIKRELAKGE